MAFVRFLRAAVRIQERVPMGIFFGEKGSERLEGLQSSGHWEVSAGDSDGPLSHLSLHTGLVFYTLNPKPRKTLTPLKTLNTEPYTLNPKP